MQNLENIGIVVIGRNEGDRLYRCLLSITKQVKNIVYVDSGSTDGSIEMAQSLGVEVVKLDLSLPFTAARARNAGFTHLLNINQQIELVQFVDGDCEIFPKWLETAKKVLDDESNIAVVCGRRRERFPEKSIYNRLCDLEWDTPIGEALTCGGDSMIRVSAFQQVQGFNPTLIAGEEPELCVRLRQQNWKILRIDADMTLHDAAMTKFSQWWKRALRAGYAYAEGSWLHGNSPQRHWVQETKSIWFWGLILPLITLITIYPSKGWSVLMLMGYPLMTYKIYRYLKQRKYSSKDTILYALACLISKLPQVQGQINFHFNRLLKQKVNLIEYKY
ncbi:family 2 glycosyl transferase [Chondrocystis sp. NIES-4102]|nr:family 2 glycosyl transferase [Chondrocystis sp. NIES-4102]